METDKMTVTNWQMIYLADTQNFVYLHIDIYEIGFNFEGTLFYLDISIDAFEKTEYINDIAL